jgi:uncharacterized YigZ family protein
MSFSIPTEILETTYEVKKSLFHCRAGKADNREEAFALRQQCINDYPDARHHCWAYLFGDPKQPISIAMSDDGEPSGTAGKPMLNVLQHNTVGSVMVVVSRYFGGIKLGAGGLVRAYSAATKQTLDQLETATFIPMAQMTISTDFKYEQLFRHFIEAHNGSIDACHYTAQVTLALSLPKHVLQELHELCNSNGATLLESHI